MLSVMDGLPLLALGLQDYPPSLMVTHELKEAKTKLAQAGVSWCLRVVDFCTVQGLERG